MQQHPQVHRLVFYPLFFYKSHSRLLKYFTPFFSPVGQQQDDVDDDEDKRKFFMLSIQKSRRRISLLKMYLYILSMNENFYA